MSNEHALAAALAHELREQSRFPSGQPRISPEKAREIVAAALRSQPVEAGESEYCGGNGYSGGVNTGSGEYDDCCEVCLGSGKARLTSLSQQPAPEVVPHNPARVQWAAPGDQQEDTWIVRFSDKDCGEAVFTGPDAEREAWEYWNRYSRSYNIYVFRLARIDHAIQQGERG